VISVDEQNPSGVFRTLYDEQVTRAIRPARLRHFAILSKLLMCWRSSPLHPKRWAICMGEYIALEMWHEPIAQKDVHNSAAKHSFPPDPCQSDLSGPLFNCSQPSLFKSKSVCNNKQSFTTA